jgi:hypothetical protein
MIARIPQVRIAQPAARLSLADYRGDLKTVDEEEATRPNRDDP